MKYNCDIESIQSDAEQGNPDAQYALGYMYYYGINTVKDPQTAVLWIKRAAAQGQPLAQKALSLINNGATFNDLHKAATGEEPVAQNGVTSASASNQSVPDQTADVTSMNAKTATQPITNHLPAYGQSPAQNPEVINSLKNQTSALDPRLSSHAKPLTTSAEVESAKYYGERGMQAAQNNQTYTIQLLGSNHLSDLKYFTQDNNIVGKTQYFKTTLNGRSWYMLTYGSYASQAAAELALQKLPASLMSYHPWIKSLKTVQKEVKLQKVVS